ncbi:MAG: hypothetical protein ACFCU6_15055 [Balneolaceae bacterium]
MKFLKLLCFTLCLLVTSCSVTNSDSGSDEIHGKVIDQNGEPVNNASIGVIYTFSEAQTDPTNINQFPNPFTGATTIQFVLETPMNYKLTAENLKTSNKATIIDSTFSSGHHGVTFSPTEELDIGFLKISDNVGNETIAFNAPGFPIWLSNTVNTLQVAGNIVGDVYTSTDEDGNFQFNSEKILNVQESFLITNEEGRILGSFVLNKKYYLVAFIDNKVYDSRLADHNELTNGIEFTLTTN